MKQPTNQLLEQKVTFYISRLENSPIPIESYDLAMSYLKEEVGLDVDYAFMEDKQLVVETDHITKFKIIELSESEFVEKDNNVLYHTLSESEPFFGLKNALTFGKYARDLMKAVEKNGENDWFATPGVHSLSLGEIIINGSSEIAADFKKNQVREYSKTILHEFGHLTGLTHTHDDYFGKREDYLGLVWNIMSYERPALEGKYGCAFDEGDKKIIRNYFKTKGQYQLLKKCEFNLSRYCDALEKMNKTKK